MSRIKSSYLGLIPAGLETFYHPPAILRGTEPIIALTRVLLILLLSLSFFFFLDFGVLTLNMNIRLPPFCSTWSRARGPDSATCAGRAHGRASVYGNRRASELKLQKCLAIVFLELSKILENNGLQWRFFNPHPPDWWPPQGQASSQLWNSHQKNCWCLLHSVVMVDHAQHWTVLDIWDLHTCKI